MNEPAHVPQNAASLESDIARLVGVLRAEHYPSAARAALRRWAPGQPVPLAFYRLWLNHLGRDLPEERQTEAWMTIVWGLATGGAASHDSQRPLGLALAAARFAEGRLERLLSAPEDVRLDLFMSAVRFLAAKDERFNWFEAARFVLTHDPDKRERINRRIARDYFRAIANKE
ncbi:MAG: type I-E CRISPR-associated protein Cse2/CasB [Thiobacillaceae bacterium]